MEELDLHIQPLNSSGNISSQTLSRLKDTQSALLHSSTPQYIGLFFMIILDMVALAGNVAVAVVIIKTPRLRKFLFVIHLCVIDTLAALTVMPLGIMESTLSMGYEDSFCQSYASLEVCFNSASILTISAINIERYYYIVHPMAYEVKMTLRLAISVLVFIWIQSSLTSIVPFLGFTHVDGTNPNNASLMNVTHCSMQRNLGHYRKAFVTFFLIMYFIVPLLIILTVYCNVFKVARIAALQQGPLPSWAGSPRQRSNSNGSQTNIMTGIRSHLVSSNRTVGGAKAAFTLIVTGGQFIMCWLPYFVFHVNSALKTDYNVEHKWENIVRWLAYTTFTVNPLFYGCLNRQIRAELTQIPKCFLKQSLDEELGLSSREGSEEENFLQFLQRTSCVVDRRNSFPTSSTSKLLVNQSTLSFRIPGQILEETPELLEQDSKVEFNKKIRVYSHLE